MKLTNTLSMKRKSGMTLLELTVVILVLLSLISILFVGARAWKKGSDRSANLMNLRNTQQAMRGAQNMRTDVTVTTFSSTDLAAYMKFPAAVSTITYAAGTTFTPVGTLWLTATYGSDTPASEFQPASTVYADW
jgi:prepilin-type N-terminal cleavage/methylation domain-containing protein